MKRRPNVAPAASVGRELATDGGRSALCSSGIQPAQGMAHRASVRPLAGWSALIASSLPLLFWPDARHVFGLLIRVAWLYLVTGARG